MRRFPLLLIVLAPCLAAQRPDAWRCGHVLAEDGVTWREDVVVTTILQSVVLVRPATPDQQVDRDFGDAWMVPGLIDLHTHLLLRPYDERSWDDQVRHDAAELRSLRAARYAELARGSEARWTAARPFTFLLVGLIHPSKGQVEAVEALSLLKRQGRSVHLVIAGDGRDAALRQRIAELDVADAVDLKGFVKDPFPLFHEAHALLMCSRNEAMGRVTVEGMACGLPVVGHASGGTVELVDDGVNGLLYPGGAEALAERMARLAADPSLAHRLGDAAARSAAGRFSVERYAGEVLEVCRAVLSDAR